MHDKDKFFIIDSHCHIYPEKIAQRAVGGTDKFYDINSACLGTVDNLKTEGGSAGINHFVVQSVATTPKQVKSINDFIASEVSAHPQKLTGLGALHPDSEDIKGDVQYIKSLGFKGVKIHPEIQGYPLDYPGFYEIFSELEANGLVLLMHSGDLRYDYSNPNKIAPMLKTFPNLTVIGAHFGGWSNWKEAHKSLASTPNFYVDCSSSFMYLTKEESLEIIKAYGTDKVLFGTDYPMWSPAKEIEYFFELDLTDDERKKILSENAIKVFGIEILQDEN